MSDYPSNQNASSYDPGRRESPRTGTLSKKIRNPNVGVYRPPEKRTPMRKAAPTTRVVVRKRPS